MLAVDLLRGTRSGIGSSVRKQTDPVQADSIERSVGSKKKTLVRKNGLESEAKAKRILFRLFHVRLFFSLRYSVA